MSVKKQRNYLLDLLKVLFCVSAIFPGHFAETVGIEVFGVNPFDATMLPGIMAGGYPFTIGTRVLGFRVLSIAIFTFLSGYWMVDHFKRNQKLGVLNKGKDREILGKYFFNVYSSYWPMAFVGTLYALLFAYITIPNLHILSHNFLNTLILTLPRLLGIKGYGLFPSVIVPMDIASSVNPNNLATLTENFTNQNAWYLFSWNQPLWYMFALIAALPMIYLVFVKSESFGLYILTPMLFLFGNIRLETYANVFALLDQGIDMDILRFVSPMALGIWGWYITDWIKRTEFSATTQKVYNVLAVLFYALMFYALIEGVGGFHIVDITCAGAAIVTLALKDPFTRTLNNILNKFPLSKHFGLFAAGAYLIHYPILQTLAYYSVYGVHPEIIGFIRGLGYNQSAAVFLLFLIVLMIPYYFVDKYWVKGLTNMVRNVSKCREPVTLEETK